MKKIISYVLAGMLFYGCASTMPPPIEGNLRYLKSRTVPSRGLTHYLEFTAKKDTTKKYVLPLVGSKKELKSLKEETKDKSLSLDRFLFEGSEGLSLDQIRKMLGL